LELAAFELKKNATFVIACCLNLKLVKKLFREGDPPIAQEAMHFQGQASFSKCACFRHDEV